MEELAAAPDTAYETLVFLEFFEDLPDPRQRGKVMYPLDEVLLLALLAVLAGAETFVDIARFGAKKLSLLRRFRPFLAGTPSHDHLGDIFASCLILVTSPPPSTNGEDFSVWSPSRRPPRATGSWWRGWRASARSTCSGSREPVPTAPGSPATSSDEG